jgi:hypothetical protein
MRLGTTFSKQEKKTWRVTILKKLVHSLMLVLISVSFCSVLFIVTVSKGRFLEKMCPVEYPTVRKKR